MPDDKKPKPEGKPKRKRGRPVEKPFPDRIDASPEEIAEMVLRMPPKKSGKWRHEEKRCEPC